MIFDKQDKWHSAAAISLCRTYGRSVHNGGGYAVYLHLALIFFLTQKTKSKSLNLPPGPPGWPIVGNLFQVARSGKPFFEYVKEMKAQYGAIFTLKMGTRTMIVLTDAKLVHEALIQKGPLYASRAAENPTRNIFSANKFTVNAAVYGPVWKSLRKNMVQNMLTSTRLKEFRSVREDAMDRLINRLKVNAEKNNGVVVVVRDARRICPGLAIGTVHISLMLARMVQEFEWTADPPGKKIDFSGKMEFTVVMKESLRAVIKPRE
ncbi:hypothetical protein TSUD_40370 [Trifolium subterraneum]|uniref:Cytochrome P450 n=1 Tax=Trifolium subterraneum TaxID=3900 RepID=A0A2Z6LYZ6_TRISU|nr:hypothetical protein TSUD_40370 [Trifolium subterraneum]